MIDELTSTIICILYSPKYSVILLNASADACIARFLEAGWTVQRKTKAWYLLHRERWSGVSRKDVKWNVELFKFKRDLTLIDKKGCTFRNVNSVLIFVMKERAGQEIGVDATTTQANFISEEQENC